jgi:hypothetical protein
MLLLSSGSRSLLGLDGDMVTQGKMVASVHNQNPPYAFPSILGGCNPGLRISSAELSTRCKIPLKWV